MGKVLYSATMSLDGFIAGPGGDMSWLTAYLGPNPEIDALQRDLLGDGTRLFEHPGGRSVQLERLSLTPVPHAANLWMRVVR